MITNEDLRRLDPLDLTRYLLAFNEIVRKANNVETVQSESLRKNGRRLRGSWNQ